MDSIGTVLSEIHSKQQSTIYTCIHFPLFLLIQFIPSFFSVFSFFLLHVLSLSLFFDSSFSCLFYCSLSLIFFEHDSVSITMSCNEERATTHLLYCCDSCSNVLILALKERVQSITMVTSFQTSFFLLSPTSISLTKNYPNQLVLSQNFSSFSFPLKNAIN